MGRSKRNKPADAAEPGPEATPPPAEAEAGAAPAPDVAPDPGAPADAAAAAEAAAKADEYLALAQSVQAEYLNYRKRVAREKDDVRLAAARDWAATLLPVLDNLERAYAAGGDAATIRAGVAMIVQEFERALARLGVEPIATAGERFDPDRHEAIGTVPTGEAAAGTILTEVQRGFSFGGRVLRAPRVLVAAALPAPASPTPTDPDAAPPAPASPPPEPDAPEQE